MTRKGWWLSISIPGNSSPRWAAMTCSRDKSLAVGHGQQPREHRRDLDPGKAPLPALGIPDDDGQVERQVGDIGKRVARIHGKRGQNREDLVFEHLFDPGDVAGVKRLPVHQTKPVLGQLRHQMFVVNRDRPSTWRSTCPGSPGAGR